MKRNFLNAAGLIGMSLAGFVMAPTCAGAADRGVTGMVADPSGAPVPGASVIVAGSLAVAIRSRSTTDAEGQYLIDGLPAGTYRVSVEHPGFRMEQREGVEVREGQTARADFRLELLSHNDTVVVTESLSRVDATQMQMGETCHRGRGYCRAGCQPQLHRHAGARAGRGSRQLAAAQRRRDVGLHGHSAVR